MCGWSSQCTEHCPPLTLLSSIRLRCELTQTAKRCCCRSRTGGDHRPQRCGTARPPRPDLLCSQRLRACNDLNAGHSCIALLTLTWSYCFSAVLHQAVAAIVVMNGAWRFTRAADVGNIHVKNPRKCAGAIALQGCHSVVERSKIGRSE